ncbi:hypothetical protein Asphe3_41150 (plasmid) [Pseudarthrobacter phenanthrenivorans Sphe3]|uniref:Uncharacterized protein n=1 Tax=Pseudarthrobacter phenanthrenivorans (strain DSM 18606 / JCM 16027 / LMG 23796 / Sphe3) TaxID=930171 RepID=F0MCC9_PSEPM|nr:hypothetical protein [Pseudarthrobacter phenanthrenivorans]ADX75180.1 hypothetical protein Asphe3_41150 [Pseudarthrobacter phenanthrenivorans Sphe3]
MLSQAGARAAAARTRCSGQFQSMRFLRSMPFPDRWAPFFEPTMRLNDVYAYPTKHFDFHARQLRL